MRPKSSEKVFLYFPLPVAFEFEHLITPVPFNVNWNFVRFISCNVHFFRNYSSRIRTKEQIESTGAYEREQFHPLPHTKYSELTFHSCLCCFQLLVADVMISRFLHFLLRKKKNLSFLLPIAFFQFRVTNLGMQPVFGRPIIHAQVVIKYGAHSIITLP